MREGGREGVGEWRKRGGGGGGGVRGRTYEEMNRLKRVCKYIPLKSIMSRY